MFRPLNPFLYYVVDSVAVQRSGSRGPIASIPVAPPVSEETTGVSSFVGLGRNLGADS